MERNEIHDEVAQSQRTLRFDVKQGGNVPDTLLLVTKMIVVALIERIVKYGPFVLPKIARGDAPANQGICSEAAYDRRVANFVGVQLDVLLSGPPWELHHLGWNDLIVRVEDQTGVA